MDPKQAIIDQAWTKHGDEVQQSADLLNARGFPKHALDLRSSWAALARARSDELRCGNVVPGGAWEIPGNHPSRIVALRSQVDELRQRFESYGGGDRPMSPPAALLRELHEAERCLADAERNPAP